MGLFDFLGLNNLRGGFGRNTGWNDRGAQWPMMAPVANNVVNGTFGFLNNVVSNVFGFGRSAFHSVGNGLSRGWDAVTSVFSQSPRYPDQQRQAWNRSVMGPPDAGHPERRSAAGPGVGYRNPDTGYEVDGAGHFRKPSGRDEVQWNSVTGETHDVVRDGGVAGANPITSSFNDRAHREGYTAAPASAAVEATAGSELPPITLIARPLGA